MGQAKNIENQVAYMKYIYMLYCMCVCIKKIQKISKYIKLSACVDQGRSMNDGLCVYLFGSLVLKANCLNNS